MPKHIILFSDGTGNSSGKLSRTNVWRLYEAVDLADPQDPQVPRQFALYDNGVGTSSFRPLALLGGAFGYGLARNVRDLYAFVCRIYEPGDKIFAFGFSRGAFTVRVLVGVLMNQGVVPYDGNEEELARLTKGAYRAWRRERVRGRLSNWFIGPLRAARDAAIAFWDTCRGRRPYGSVARIGGPGSADPLRVRFMGIWDTVDAYGLPVDELTRAIDKFVWPTVMRDLNLSGRVERALHALSLDDERNTFHPRLWNEMPDGSGDPNVGVPGGNLATGHLKDERISQVWFAGVHSDVGGGYPDDGVAHVSLLWIMQEAHDCGLRLADKIWQDIKDLSDENGPIRDSRKGLAGYYRYNPRRIERLANTDAVRIGRVKIHESALRRIKAGHDGYAPLAIPPGFAVARIDGSIVDGSQYVGGDTGPRSAYAAQRERAWNWVWRRRVVYFATLAATLALIAMPLVLPGTGTCESQSAACALSGPIGRLGALLPDSLAVWTGSFRSYPGLFALLAALVAGGLVRGGQLERRIRDEMRAVWYRFASMAPPAVRFPRARPNGALNRAIQWLRLQPAYQRALHVLTQDVLPVPFLALLLALVFYVAPALVSRAGFDLWASAGHACASSAEAVPVDAVASGLSFRTNQLCAPTRLALEKGATYRIHITIPDAARWADGDIAAGPYGVARRCRSWAMIAGLPLRRHLSQPWFMPMARIGSTGSDAYALTPMPAIAPAGQGAAARKQADACRIAQPAGPGGDAADRAAPGQSFAAEIVARSSGELFLYVNDAVLLPRYADRFYRNNAGTGHVVVERVLPQLPQPSQSPQAR